MAESDIQPMIGGFYAVAVKTDCPHLKESLDENIKIDKKAQCQECDNIGENWICLTCCKVYCSRYVKEHMVKHNEDTQHPIALSFSDASIWCYSCNSYIDDPVLKPIYTSIQE